MRLDEELAAHVSMLTQTVAGSAAIVDSIVDCLCHCFDAGGKLLLIGNGGSAADAQHVAGEFVNRLTMDRRPLPAVALSTDSSVITCIANDVCYDDVFSRQVEALARPGDVLAGLSTSGRSRNVVGALGVAHGGGVLTLGFTGRTGAAFLAPVCDYVVAVSAEDCALIQEAHEFLWHRMVAAVEERLFGATAGKSTQAQAKTRPGAIT